ncbi:BPSS1780 family membrane protein [Oxalobacteraceae bacterium A2-2]
MEKLPALTGWLWVRQGFGLFRKQPGALMALLFSCMFLSIALLLVPLLGQIAPMLLAPIFSVALLQGSAAADQGRRALPQLVLSGFQKPARGPLLALGGVYVLLMLVALTVLTVLDGGVLMKMATAQIPMDQKLLDESKGAIVASSAIYVLGWLVSCFAAPLIYWQKLSLGKALFFSAYAVFRSLGAFLVCALSLFLIYQVAGAIPLLLFSSMPLGLVAMMMVFLLMVVVLHCTLYAAYRQIFGAPQLSDQAQPQQEH